MTELVAFYVGVWVGGVAALWSVAQLHGWRFRWLPAFLWAGMLKRALTGSW